MDALRISYGLAAAGCYLHTDPADLQQAPQYARWSTVHWKLPHTKREVYKISAYQIR
jgi:hypothetical protein